MANASITEPTAAVAADALRANRYDVVIRFLDEQIGITRGNRQLRNELNSARFAAELRLFVDSLQKGPVSQASAAGEAATERPFSADVAFVFAIVAINQHTGRNDTPASAAFRVLKELALSRGEDRQRGAAAAEPYGRFLAQVFRGRDWRVPLREAFDAALEPGLTEDARTDALATFDSLVQSPERLAQTIDTFVERERTVRAGLRSGSDVSSRADDEGTIALP